MVFVNLLGSWKYVTAYAIQSFVKIQMAFPFNFLLFLVSLLIVSIFFLQNEGKQKLLFFLGEIRVQLIEELCEKFLFFQGFLDEPIGAVRKDGLVGLHWYS